MSGKTSKVIRDGNLVWKTHTPEYGVWQCMLRRCYSKSRRDYKWYGGSGITVCKMWRNSFDIFYADMGQRPNEKFELDRIDNSKGYSKENCRWTSSLENKRNTRQVSWIKIDGKKHKVVELAESLGLDKSCLRGRIYRGISRKDLLLPSRKNSNGSNNGMSRLKEKDVLEMRRRRSNGEMVKSLAKEYGISVKYASHISSGRGWEHI
jgi:hypothetical protein